VYFQNLERRLVSELRRRLRNGELTERKLGQLAGISQPHVHHLIKGVRSLSPRLADRLLKALNLSVLDLLDMASEEGPSLPCRSCRRMSPAEPSPAWFDCPLAVEVARCLCPALRETRQAEPAITVLRTGLAAAARPSATARRRSKSPGPAGPLSPN
jgi:transcriptional regulator with XRE-family HTH domain